MIDSLRSLQVYRPARFVGTATGAALVGVAVLLAILLLAFAGPWAISAAKFLAFVGAFALLALAALFAYWTWACLTLSYALDEKGLSIRWGLIRQFVPLGQIERFVPGREARLPAIGGVNWWAYHVGRASVEGLGEVLFYSTHQSPWEPIYIVTPSRSYAISPENSVRFTMELQRLKKQEPAPEAHPPLAEAAEAPKQRAEHPALAMHPFWLDRYGQALALVAVLANVALFGFIFGVYPGLADKLNLAFPPLGPAELRPKREVLQIPVTALALLAVSLAAGLAVHKWERAASYLLLSGAIFLQSLLWVAAAIAIT
ncbi:MAG: PH domain-containing protein [Chloroflexota bacterium]|nr:PH domain-containing protein [Chloroflexota bacterium]